MVICVLDQAVLDASYLPETLCIDEFKANTGEGKMAIAIADGGTGYLVDILPELTDKCMNGFLGGFGVKERLSVRFFCCDMSPMFIRAKKEWFSDAILVLRVAYFNELDTYAGSRDLNAARIIEAVIRIGGVVLRAFGEEPCEDPDYGHRHRVDRNSPTSSSPHLSINHYRAHDRIASKRTQASLPG